MWISPHAFFRAPMPGNPAQIPGSWWVACCTVGPTPHDLLLPRVRSNGTYAAPCGEGSPGSTLWRAAWPRASFREDVRVLFVFLWSPGWPLTRPGLWTRSGWRRCRLSSFCLSLPRLPLSPLTPLLSLRPFWLKVFDRNLFPPSTPHKVRFIPWWHWVMPLPSVGASKRAAVGIWAWLGQG